MAVILGTNCIVLCAEGARAVASAYHKLFGRHTHLK